MNLPREKRLKRTKPPPVLPNEVQPQSDEPGDALRIAVWMEGPQEVDELGFMFFLVGANTVQASLRFHFPDPPDELDYATARARLLSGCPIHSEHYQAHVFITSRPIEGNLFWLAQGPVVLITTATWERHFAPPSLFEYLLHSILCAVTTGLSEGVESHDEFTMGCQFEYTRIKAHDRIDIALGYICEDHARQIQTEFGDRYLNDLRLLFSFGWLGRVDEPGTLASRLRAYFGQDLQRDSGYSKRFWERIRPNLDALWFDIGKELFKAFLLIVTTFLLIKFGLQHVK